MSATHGRPALLRRTAAILLASLGVVAVSLAPAAPAAAYTGPFVPGRLVLLGGSEVAMTPVLYEQGDEIGTLVYEVEPQPGRFSFRAQSWAEAAYTDLGASSVLAPPYWATLQNTPALVPDSPTSLMVVFSGSRSGSPKDPYGAGCLVGADRGPLPLGPAAWHLQTWSLSARCNIFQSDAVKAGDGQVAAAWQGDWNGGHGLLYRLEPSSHIPAIGPDSEIPLPQTGSVDKMAVAADDAGNGDTWLYWGQLGSPPAASDGWYAKNLTGNGPIIKAPGSARGSADVDIFARPAFAATNTHPGIFAAYDVPPSGPGEINCSNGQYCTLRLWRVGTPKAVAVPGAVHVMADNVALSAGPQGRLWIAWFDSRERTINVVRTNEADTRFSAVQTFPTQCDGYGLIGLSAGSVDVPSVHVGLECPTHLPANGTTKTAPDADYVWLLTVDPVLNVEFDPSVANTVAHTLHFYVTDVGDPVPGAVVKVGTVAKTTGPAGVATITIPKGRAPGRYPVAATAYEHIAFQGTLQVTT